MLEAARATSHGRRMARRRGPLRVFQKRHRLQPASTSFQVELARSRRTLTVPSGRSIIEVLRARRCVDVPSSCEQGACGTCLVTVLAGEPDHHDVFLNDTEKAAGDTILTCVSRCSSPRLVLDL